MTFSPNKPELPTDLICWCDTDINQAALLIYTSDEGDFYRNENIWKEISPDSDWEFDFDGLITVCVDPSFIPIYDKAEADNSELPIEEVVKYESVKLGQE